jgi:hypothetical protein
MAPKEIDHTDSRLKDALGRAADPAYEPPEQYRGIKGR